jgi:hypothetical protein
MSTTSTSSAIPPTLLSIVFVTFRSCAAAIRASSCVSLSSLFSASSTSAFPISFFRYCSGNGSISGNLFVQHRLTGSALFEFLCSNCKDVKDLDQYCHDCVHHFLIWGQFNVYLEPSEKRFYALEHFNECVLIRADILNSLRVLVLRWLARRN